MDGPLDSYTLLLADRAWVYTLEELGEDTCDICTCGRNCIDRNAVAQVLFRSSLIEPL